MRLGDYSYSVVTQLIIVFMVVQLTRELNILGSEYYAAFIFCSAFMNFAPIMEYGLGGWLQNYSARVGLSEYFNILRIVIYKWIKISLLFFILLIFFLELFGSLLPIRSSLGMYSQNYENLIYLGILAGFGLSIYRLLARSLLGLGRNKLSYSVAMTPYVFGFSLFYSCYMFFDEEYFELYFIGVSASAIIIFIYLFYINKAGAFKFKSNAKRREQGGFFVFSILGVFQLNSDVLIGGLFISADDMAIIGVFQRVYFSSLMLAGVVNSFFWRKFTVSSELPTIKIALIRLLSINALLITLFSLLLFFLKDFWLDYFSLSQIVSTDVHVLVGLGLLVRVVTDVFSTFLQSRSYLYFLNVSVVFQSISTALLYFYFYPNIELKSVLFIQIVSGLIVLSLLLIKTFGVIKYGHFDHINTNVQ